MTKRYLGNIITQNPTAPAGDLANSAAKGVWSLEEQLAYQKAGLWPVPGNFPLDVEDVFSTYLYTGNDASKTITNGIDLAGEGGLVWRKERKSISGGYPYNILIDTERGGSKVVFSDLTNAEVNFGTAPISSFNSNGFTIVDNDGAGLNLSTNDYASWTFRKAPKFFTCLTYTGDGVAGREISHSLGAVPGVMIIKKTSATEQWAVYHRSEGNTKYGMLDQTNAFSTFSGAWNNTTPTDTVFTVGNWAKVNQSGQTYVAYLFAHNDGDGGFGADGDADIIKCGSVTTSSNLGTVDLGFEPQFVLVKKSSAGGHWHIFDSMRGMVVGSGDKDLKADSSEAEGTNNTIDPTATGFKSYGSDGNYIYIAIRRGTKVPESGTEVFNTITRTGNGTTTSVTGVGFPPDLFISKPRTGSSGLNSVVVDRLRGAKIALATTGTFAEQTENDGVTIIGQDGVTVGASQSGFFNGVNYPSDTLAYWNWKRAPGFFDAVAYTGTGSARDLPHNLQAVPEMYWIKARDEARGWIVYADINGTYKENLLNSTTAFSTASSIGGDPTDSVIKLSTTFNENRSGYDYIAYLFASLPGISKVGSYTGTGSALNIDCGFTSGARFVLIKRTDNQSPWWVWDSERGIIAGNDPWLELNSTAAEVTNTDYIDPYSAGFTLTIDGNWLYGMNYPSGEYIFYAIA